MDQGIKPYCSHSMTELNLITFSSAFCKPSLSYTPSIVLYIASFAESERL